MLSNVVHSCLRKIDRSGLGDFHLRPNKGTNICFVEHFAYDEMAGGKVGEMGGAEADRTGGALGCQPGVSRQYVDMG